MDKKINVADNPTDSLSSSQNDVEQDKGAEVSNLEGWELTSEQRKFIESLQKNKLDSESDC